MQFPLPVDRGKLRMERLKQLELEQLQWEQEALVMPEDLNRALFLSFESVKTEFSDLDGLSWSRYPVPLVTNPWVVEEPTPKLTSTQIDEFPIMSDSCDALTPAHSPTLSHNHPRVPTNPLPCASSSGVDTGLFVPQDTSRLSRPTPSSWSSPQSTNKFFLTQCGTSYKDPLIHGPRPPCPQPPANLALARHGLRRSAYGDN